MSYEKKEDGLYVKDNYNRECRQTGWNNAIDLEFLMSLLLVEQYCPSCHTYNVLSVEFDQDPRKYHYCPNCFWQGTTI